MLKTHFFLMLSLQLKSGPSLSCFRGWFTCIVSGGRNVAPWWLLCILSQFPARWLPACNLKSAMVGLFTPQKWVSATTNQGFPLTPRELVYQYTTEYNNIMMLLEVNMAWKGKEGRKEEKRKEGRQKGKGEGKGKRERGKSKKKDIC